MPWSRQTAHISRGNGQGKESGEAIAFCRSSGYVEVDPFNDEPYAHRWFEKRFDDRNLPLQSRARLARGKTASSERAPRAFAQRSQSLYRFVAEYEPHQRRIGREDRRSVRR